MSSSIHDGDYSSMLQTHNLLPRASEEEEEEMENGHLLYRASFTELEDASVNYDTWQWVLISMFMILVYGVGLLMLLYTPIRRRIVRADIQSRRLYLTTEAIVYKVARPVWLPCLGVNRREKHILLPLVTDVVVEQGCLQSRFGIHLVKVENAGQGGPNPGADVSILGVVEPKLFKRLVLMAASARRQGQSLSRHDVAMVVGSDAPLDYEECLGVPQRAEMVDEPRSKGGIKGSRSRENVVVASPLVAPGGTFIVDNQAVVQRLDEMGKTLKTIAELLSQQHIQPQQPQPQVQEEVVAAGSVAALHVDENDL